MSIIVVCRGCLKSYKVSDKHAGKTAPCPNCKRPLQVPTKESEVKVHAPEEFGGGGKSTTGKLITKPIAHVNVRLKPTTAAILAASVAGVLAVTWSLGHAGLFDVDRVGVFHAVVTASVGLLLISPPLAVAAYEMLRDDEFEPFRGRSLYLRSAACGWAYASLWGAFAILSRLHRYWRGVELVLRPALSRRRRPGADGRIRSGVRRRPVSQRVLSRGHVVASLGGGNGPDLERTFIAE